jgi:hypothetical protein
MGGHGFGRFEWDTLYHLMADGISYVWFATEFCYIEHCLERTY